MNSGNKVAGECASLELCCVGRTQDCMYEVGSERTEVQISAAGGRRCRGRKLKYLTSTWDKPRHTREKGNHNETHG